MLGYPFVYNQYREKKARQKGDRYIVRHRIWEKTKPPAKSILYTISREKVAIFSHQLSDLTSKKKGLQTSYRFFSAEFFVAENSLRRAHARTKKANALHMAI